MELTKYCEDYIYEIVNKDGAVIATDYVSLDAAIEYALGNNGWQINKICYEVLRSEDGKEIPGETTTAEIIWEREAL